MAAHIISFPGLPTRRLSSRGRGVWPALRAMVQARQTRRQLAEMEDRLLSDIGVSRGTAREEAARPFWDV